MTAPESESSYVHGASDTPLLGLTIGQCFDQTVSRHPDGLALVVEYQEVRWTWRELQSRVDEYAAGLVALGLEPGQRIGICAPNRWEWVVVQFASAKAGLILVNINPAYRLPELAYALKKTGCSALVTASSLRSSDYIEMLNELFPDLSSSKPGQLKDERFPELKSIILLSQRQSAGMLCFEDLSALARDTHKDRVTTLASSLQFDDPINIQFTSGTTGAPKAATLTHHNIVNNAWFVGRKMQLRCDDRMCIPVPMYHCFGMVLGTLCCVAHGAAMVFSSEGFQPHAVLETVQRASCTILHGVPTMFISLLEQPDYREFDLQSLRSGIMAGAPCPAELMRQVMDEMHLSEITIAYGMTETGPVSFQTDIHDSEERRVTTVGQVLPHIEIKIVDEEGRVVQRNQDGELLTRGYCVMPGYWQDKKKTAKAIDQAGWIASGDIARLDDEGFCQIVGRSKDMLIRGGENIYPREIEDYLYTHPDIEQVEVIGVPDKRLGEQVCAWIKLRAGASLEEDAVRDYCQGKISHFKIPHYIRFVENYPMTVTGKVQKYRMREIMAEEMK